MTSLETDYAQWAAETAERIRAGRLEGVNLAALAEEIETLGGNEPSEVESRLTQLLMHLLKWEYQPEYRRAYGEKSWRVSIRNQRIALKRAFRRSPSLRPYAEESLAELYSDAVGLAQDDTGLVGLFPKECPYTLGPGAGR